MSWEAHMVFRRSSEGILDYASTGLITVQSQTFGSPNDTYPTSRDGFTFGLVDGPYMRASAYYAGAPDRFSGSFRFINSASFAGGVRIDLPTTGDFQIAAGCGRIDSNHPSLAKGDVRFRDGYNGPLITTSSSAGTSGNSTDIRDIFGSLKTFDGWESDPGWYDHTFVNAALHIEWNSDSYAACVSIRQVGGAAAQSRQQQTAQQSVLGGPF